MAEKSSTGPPTIKVHENIIWLINLEEGARNITGDKVPLFVSKNGGLNKDGIRGMIFKNTSHSSVQKRF